MRNDIVESDFPRGARLTGNAATAALVLVVRACAFVVFLLMSMAEPFLAIILSTLALGCFFVAVLFGFIFHAPFPHRWFVLGASVVFLMLYVLYGLALQGVQRLLR
jgi:hypothetical protein